MSANSIVIETRWYKDDTELAELVNILNACFPDGVWTKQRLVRFGDKPGHVVKAIVTEDDLVIGALLHCNSLHNCCIVWIGVHPDWRRRGVALAALMALTGLQSPNRRRFYSAWVNEYEVPAQLLFRKAGFMCVEQQPSAADTSCDLPAGDMYRFLYERPDTGRRHREVIGTKMREM